MLNSNEGYGLSTLKKYNQKLIFRTIYHREPISRTEITEITGLAPTTVTNIVKKLINDGLLRESGYSGNTQGRRRVFLKVNQKRHYILGIDLNRSYFTIVLSDLKTNILNKHNSKNIKNIKPEKVINKIISSIKNLIKESKISEEKIIGIGIGAPGPLDINKGIILNPPNFKDWNNIPIKKIIEKKLNIPVYLDNDARACAMGEKLFGIAKDKNNFVYLAWGTGIGSAYYSDGKFHKGYNGIAGEIGHTTVNINGPECSCGNIGCLELYASMFSIVDKYNESHINKKTCDICIIRDILINYKIGETWAVKIIEEIGKYLGVAATNLINIYGTQYVILGREIPSIWGEYILKEIKKYVKNNNLFSLSKTPEVMLAKFKEEESTIGAVSIVINAFLKGLI